MAPPPGPARALRVALSIVLLLATLAACARLTSLQPQPGEPTPTPTVTPTARATPVATVVGPVRPAPIAPPSGLVPARTLAFVSDRGGQVDLWLTDIETGQLWRLTDDTAIETYPVWSPDGARLAYVVEDQRAIRDLWLLDLHDGSKRQLTHEAPPFDVRRPAWLAGGRVLLYDTGKPFDRRPELRSITTDGQQLSPIVPDDGSIIWDWSTNGQTLIAAVGPLLGEPQIIATDAVPGAALTVQPNAPVGFAVELSPDGRYATFAGPPLSDDQTTSLLTLSTGTATPLNETINGRRYEHDFAWLPDNQRLVFVHGAGGVTDGQGRLRVGTGPPPTSDASVGLWLTARTGGATGRQREQLTTGSADAAPRPSPDGRWIAFLTDTQVPNPTESNITLIAVAAPSATQAREVKPLTSGRGNNWSPAWMPLR
jgi:Tol biopolymer transport system component